MAKPLYSTADENSLLGVVPTLESGSLGASAYPLSHLGDTLPATLNKLSTTTGRWVWDCVSPRQIDVVGFFNFNADAGHAGVVWQGNASNAWGSPTLSVPVVIPGVDRDGFRPNPFLDISAQASRVFRFWSLAVTTANSVALTIGEVWGASLKRELSPNFSDGIQFDEDHPLLASHRTSRGVQFNMPSGTRVRSCAGQVDCGGPNATTEFEALRNWYRQARGMAQPFLYVPDAAVNDALVMGFTMPKFRWTEKTIGRYLVPVSMEEYARGVAV